MPPPVPPKSPRVQNSAGAHGRDSPGAVRQRPKEVSRYAYQLICMEAVRLCADDEDFGKLEMLGFQIGHRFAERCARAHARFSSTLEVVKFLCKDVWASLFGKQVDKLQTNHKGVYVLHDNAMSWTSHLEVDHQSAESVEAAKKYLVMPCGLIRGALSNMGVKCTVRAEFASLPTCFFNIHVHEQLLHAQ